MTSLTQEQLINWMKLTRVKNLGPKRIGDLIRIFGGIDGIVSASNEELLRSRAFREGMLPEWEKLKNAAEDNFKTVIDECKENKVQILTFLDEAY
ncbi:hypothetical protein HZB90_01670, partial [archaeon]|nr:hypothetical protein [archaeon]